MRPDHYVSSVVYEGNRIHAAAVYCSDGRLGEQFDDFLRNGLALPNYDRVACPGGPIALSGRLSAYWEARGVEEQLGFLAQVHEIHVVVLIAHVGCAYYGQRLDLPPGQVEAEQRIDLRKAADAVQRLIPGIEVLRYIARVAGPQVGFEAVTD